MLFCEKIVVRLAWCCLVCDTRKSEFDTLDALGGSNFNVRDTAWRFSAERKVSFPES